jgi:DNA-binding LacI/PurR family transcriptional regulator
VLLDADWPVNYQRLGFLEREGIQLGYRFMIGQIFGDALLAGRYVADFDSWGVEAMVCFFNRARGDVATLNRVFEGRSNVVFHGPPITKAGYSVQVDTADAIYQSVDHLVNQGRRRIGLLLSDTSDPFNRLRHDAFKSALKRKGISSASQFVWSAGRPIDLPPAELIDRALNDMIDHQDVDALIAEDDVWAVRIIQQLRQRGIRVPDDVGVIGYDNLDLATVIEPALTTVDQCHRELARTILRVLKSLSDEGSGGRNRTSRVTKIRAKLIVRNST